jgi:hypothetical protein
MSGPRSGEPLRIVAVFEILECEPGHELKRSLKMPLLVKKLPHH